MQVQVQGQVRVQVQVCVEYLYVCMFRFRYMYVYVYMFRYGVQVLSGCCTFRLGHHHGEEPDGSVDVTEPAAVELEENGGLGHHS